jgi:hypothetical protein
MKFAGGEGSLREDEDLVRLMMADVLRDDDGRRGSEIESNQQTLVLRFAQEQQEISARFPRRSRFLLSTNAVLFARFRPHCSMLRGLSRPTVPQVTRFVVIDDEDDGLDDLPLFQPSATTGLTGEIVRSVVQYLDGKTDKDMRSSRVERLLQNVQSTLKGHPG